MKKTAIMIAGLLILAVLFIHIFRPHRLAQEEPDTAARMEEAENTAETESFYGQEEKEPQETQQFTAPQKPRQLEFAADYGWNLLTSASLLRGCAFAEDGRLYSDSDKTIAANILADEDGCFVFYAPGQEAQFVFYDGKGQVLCQMSVCAQDEQQIEYPKECRAFSLCMEDGALEKAILARQSEDLFIVSQKLDFANPSVGGVVQKISEGNILVFPGVYEEHIRAFGKKIALYGVSRESCIIESTSANYYTPPLEIGAGLVENMTIRAVDKNSALAELLAYAVHVEDNGLCDNTLTFRNCTLYSDFNSAVGMGLRGGCEVLFEHCVLRGRENGLFCHDSPYHKYSGVQRLTLTDCVVAGMQGKNAIRLDSQGVAGALVKLLFCDNEFISGDGTGDSLLHTQNNNGRGDEGDFLGLKNFRLLSGSRNNNIAELNFKDSQSLQ